MIGLLVLAFFIILVCSSWLLIQKIASLNARWQYCIAVPLIGFVILVPLQLYSGYSLASAWGPAVIPIAACFATVALMVMVWHKNRKAFYVSLAVLLSFAVGSCLSWSLLLLDFLFHASAAHAPEERISPIASYQIVQDLGIWGGAPPTYSYEIYENPRGLPFVQKKVAVGPVPCGNSSDADSLLIEPEANDQIVLVSCRKPKPGFSPIQIPLDQ